MTSSSSLEAPIVREALAADTAALALLMSELGYPVTPEVLSSRLAKMPSAHCTFVAELLLRGEISNQTFEEWNRETGSAKLPERVKPKKRKKSMAKSKAKRS